MDRKRLYDSFDITRFYHHDFCHVVYIWSCLIITYRLDDKGFFLQSLNISNPQFDAIIRYDVPGIVAKAVVGSIVDLNYFDLLVRYCKNIVETGSK